MDRRDFLKGMLAAGVAASMAPAAAKSAIETIEKIPSLSFSMFEKVTSVRVIKKADGWSQVEIGGEQNGQPMVFSCHVQMPGVAEINLDNISVTGSPNSTAKIALGEDNSLTLTDVAIMQPQLERAPPKEPLSIKAKYQPQTHYSPHNLLRHSEGY